MEILHETWWRSINLATPVWLAFAVWCVATGRVSVWVAALIVLSHVRVEYMAIRGW